MTTPTQTMNDLLVDPILTIRETPASTETRDVSLPKLLALCDEFPDLVPARMRPHQEHALLSTLVYLIAACGAQPHRDEELYRKKLLALAKGCREAFHIYVEDVSKPAWMQSPGIPTKKGDVGEGTDLYSPASLEPIFTADNYGPSKNHLLHGDTQDWFLAITSNQAQSIPVASNGTTARGNIGRVAVSFITSLGFGARVTRFAKVALANRARIVNDHQFAAKGGEVLLWLRPFVTGNETYDRHDLNPFFLDDSAKIRIFKEGGALLARRFTFEPQQRPDGSQKRKFDRVTLENGVTGDLWTPVRISNDGKPVDQRKAYSARIDKSDISGPWSYDRVVKILFSKDFDLPLAFEERLGAESGYLLFQAIGVGANAVTSGWNERVIPVDNRVLEGISNQTVGVFAETHMKVAHAAEGILKEALMTLMKAENMKSKKEKDFSPLITGYVINLHNTIDAEFFQGLTKRTQGAPLSDWVEFVLQAMRAQFDAAISLMPRGRGSQAYALAREVLNKPFVQEKKGKAKKAALAKQEVVSP